MKKNHLPLYIISTIITIVMIGPFLWGLMLSFKDNYHIFNEPTAFPTKLDFGLYVQTFKSAHIATLFKNSLSLAIVTSVIELIIIFFSSFAIARLDHKFKTMGNITYYMFLAASAVPAFLLLVTYYGYAITLGTVSGGVLGLNSIWGLMLPYIAGGLPFMTLMLVGGMKGIPLEIEEAGIVDGCSLLRVLYQIDLPIIRPVLVTLFIFSFLGVWNEYAIASIQLNDTASLTLPLAMSFFKDQFSTDYGSILRGVVIILLPQVLFYAIFQKQIVEGMVTAGVKG